MTPEPEETPQELKSYWAHVVAEGDELRVTLREGSLGTCGFLLFWLTGWTVACVAIAWLIYQTHEPLVIFIGVPFWIGWLAAAGYVAWSMLGRCRLTLSPRGLDYRTSVLLRSSRREFPLAELIEFKVRKRARDSQQGMETVIEIQTVGRSLQLAAALPTRDRLDVCRRLQDHLQRLRNLTGTAKPVDGDTDDCRHCEMPSDSDWRQSDFSENLTFIQHGHFRFVGMI